MAYLARFTPRSLTAEQNGGVNLRLNGGGILAAGGDGLPLLLRSLGNLRVSVGWDSQEQFQAFGEHLRPGLAKVGVDPGEPEHFDVYNVGKR